MSFHNRIVERKRINKEDEKMDIITIGGGGYICRLCTIGISDYGQSEWVDGWYIVIVNR